MSQPTNPPRPSGSSAPQALVADKNWFYVNADFTVNAGPVRWNEVSSTKLGAVSGGAIVETGASDWRNETLDAEMVAPAGLDAPRITATPNDGVLWLAGTTTETLNVTDTAMPALTVPADANMARVRISPDQTGYLNTRIDGVAAATG
ncbi:MAG: hypothetical protein ACRC2U_09725, partial [Aeromonas sp.]